MRILHDWDDPDLYWIDAFKQGMKLLVYSACKLFHIRFSYIEDIYTQTDKYAETLVKLNSLVGVEGVFGIRDCVAEEKPNAVTYLKDSGQDVRKHIHILKKGPNRKRLWEPPLTQSMDTWHFDNDYYKGIKVKLKEGELPIFHVDRPSRLPTYIDFLYENRSELKK